jgi:hypothetical protein
LTFNGRTILIKSHSIDNNTIYVLVCIKKSHVLKVIKYIPLCIHKPHYFLFIAIITYNTVIYKNNVIIIIIVQVRYITIETKEVIRIGYNGLPFPHEYSDVTLSNIMWGCSWIPPHHLYSTTLIVNNSSSDDWNGAKISPFHYTIQ